MIYYEQHKEQVLQHLQTTEYGLTEEEALARLKKYGLNKLNIKSGSLFKKLI